MLHSVEQLNKNQYSMNKSPKMKWNFWFCLGVIWRRKWQPTPVFLPGEPQGQRSLAGYSPQGRKELDTTAWPNNNTSLGPFWLVMVDTDRQQPSLEKEKLNRRETKLLCNYSLAACNPGLPADREPRRTHKDRPSSPQVLVILLLAKI